MPSTPSSKDPAEPDRRSSDASWWNWLLLVPIVVPLSTPLFNHRTPQFLDFPLFYWLQLAFVLLGVGCTAVVYNRTKRRD